VIENDNFIKNDKAILTKFKWSLNLEGMNYIEICAKFREKGNYIMAIFRRINTVKAINFFVKVDDNLEKCVTTEFNIKSAEERNTTSTFKELVRLVIVESFLKLNDGEMIKEGNKFYTEDLSFSRRYPTELVAYKYDLCPLFDDESYEFNEDINGEMFENRITFNKNVIKKYLNPRELKNLNKNILFNENWQKWFYYSKKYYMIGNDGKAQNMKVDDTAGHLIL